ncbi:response regulator transcription factor [Variovorax sp. NFACC27]|uniref:Response regulator transcription factor n=1 Tax=Variovorax gossypii TaxID=1679495 RepID=A0A3S0J4Z2_9BURK|nr:MULTISPECIES: response regulator transcription factor [Variovorax]SEF25855.1 two component transcriptional regulator, LuxR family [Variovorax sp. NFACC28]SEG48865.1 two component transcriptional regulator, LuxR family [Variovorax sp. NFACC29]SFC23016.1 two component transcriptional regulator, LuxR family [Variovorax sp. NFACC26]SFG63743.1 two component transcriptional regulator, LuxR family [Variovorax sp. NFACC27]RTQ31251.1 response regulator transcription factor [Variovorax gossypii]
MTATDRTSSPIPEATQDPARPRAILVVDDHDLVRMGVCALLQANVSATPIEVLEAGDLAEAMAIYEDNQDAIELVLLDLALPDTQGLSGLMEFRSRYPAARVVVLSGTGTTSLAQDTLAQGAMTLGAFAFLPKSATLREVVSFIRACGLLGGDAVNYQAFPAPSVVDVAQPSSSNARHKLTKRQLQVLNWLLEGKSNHEIALLAEISEGTVKNYVAGILLQFGMRSRAQLISSLR